jgi:uncharacterized coiled-coil protein SlyX
MTNPPTPDAQAGTHFRYCSKCKGIITDADQIIGWHRCHCGTLYKTVDAQAKPTAGGKMTDNAAKPDADTREDSVPPITPIEPGVGRVHHSGLAAPIQILEAVQQLLAKLRHFPQFVRHSGESRWYATDKNEPCCTEAADLIEQQAREMQSWANSCDREHGRCEDLERQIKSHERDYLTACTALGEAEAERDALRAELTAACGERNMAQIKVTALTDTVTELQAEYDRAQKALRDLLDHLPAQVSYDHYVVQARCASQPPPQEQAKANVKWSCGCFFHTCYEHNQELADRLSKQPGTTIAAARAASKD